MVVITPPSMQVEACIPTIQSIYEDKRVDQPFSSSAIYNNIHE
jgi:hypothetical protein